MGTTPFQPRQLPHEQPIHHNLAPSAWRYTAFCKAIPLNPTACARPSQKEVTVKEEEQPFA